MCEKAWGETQKWLTIGWGLLSKIFNRVESQSWDGKDYKQNWKNFHEEREIREGGEIKAYVEEDVSKTKDLNKRHLIYLTNTARLYLLKY